MTIQDLALRYKRAMDNWVRIQPTYLKAGEGLGLAFDTLSMSQRALKKAKRFRVRDKVYEAYLTDKVNAARAMITERMKIRNPVEDKLREQFLASNALPEGVSKGDVLALCEREKWRV